MHAKTNTLFSCLLPLIVCNYNVQYRAGMINQKWLTPKSPSLTKAFCSVIYGDFAVQRSCRLFHNHHLVNINSLLWNDLPVPVLAAVWASHSLFLSPLCAQRRRERFIGKNTFFKTTTVLVRVEAQLSVSISCTVEVGSLHTPKPNTFKLSISQFRTFNPSKNSLS